jgi:hypothetical protein
LVKARIGPPIENSSVRTQTPTLNALPVARLQSLQWQ